MGQLIADLILEEESSEGPYSTEDEEQLVNLLVSVGGNVLWCQLGLQQVAEGLDHADLLYGRDHLETVRTVYVEECGDVALEQDCEVCFLRLELAFVYPALHVPSHKDSVCESCVGVSVCALTGSTRGLQG